jgi:hypothetical protein
VQRLLHYCIPLREEPRRVVRCTAHHHAVHHRQVARDLRRFGHPAVDHNYKAGEISFELIHLTHPLHNLRESERSRACNYVVVTQPGYAGNVSKACAVQQKAAAVPPAILSRGKSTQDRVARMSDKDTSACVADLAHKISNKGVVFSMA